MTARERGRLYGERARYVRLAEQYALLAEQEPEGSTRQRYLLALRSKCIARTVVIDRTLDAP